MLQITMKYLFIRPEQLNQEDADYLNESFQMQTLYDRLATYAASQENNPDEDTTAMIDYETDLTDIVSEYIDRYNKEETQSHLYLALDHIRLTVRSRDDQQFALVDRGVLVCRDMRILLFEPNNTDDMLDKLEYEGLYLGEYKYLTDAEIIIAVWNKYLPINLIFLNE